MRLPIRVRILRRSRFNVGTNSRGGATGNYAAGVLGPGLRSFDRSRKRSGITIRRRKTRGVRSQGCGRSFANTCARGRVYAQVFFGSLPSGHERRRVEGSGRSKIVTCVTVLPRAAARGARISCTVAGAHSLRDCWNPDKYGSDRCLQK